MARISGVYEIRVSCPSCVERQNHAKGTMEMIEEATSLDMPMQCVGCGHWHTLRDGIRSALTQDAEAEVCGHCGESAAPMRMKYQTKACTHLCPSCGYWRNPEKSEWVKW